MATASVPYQAATGREYVDLTGWTGSALFTATPVSGDQIEGPDALTYPTDENPTGADGTYTLRLIQADGSVEAVSYVIDTAEPPAETSSATATAPFVAPTGKTVVTLASDFDPYIFQDWSTQPVVGEQIVFTDSELTIDTLANVTTDNEGVFDVWFVASDGTVTATTIDTTGLASASDTTPAAFTFTDQTGVEPGSIDESNAITITDVDTGQDVPVSITGGAYAVSTDGGSTWGAFTIANTNVQLNYQIKVRVEASSEFSTAASATLTAGGVSDTFTRTTRAAVLPTQDVVLPDLSLGETDAVSIDLDNYFSGASSYTLTGLPAGSGLSFSGSVLSGNVNKDDIAGSPYTLTATAFSADGSINDAFSVTVVDDIGPSISVNPLTTLDTTPIVSGSAGDATSLTLVVTGVGTYNPTPSGGSWSQQLPTLALGDYAMTLNGQDANGNAATEQAATLRILDTMPVMRGRPGFHTKMSMGF